jgi:predicted O-methyltransferase YrrM
MNSLENHLSIKIQTPSDINEHLPTLFELAKKCKTIIEFGVRDVVSSFAFAAASPEKLTCIDIKKSSNVDPFLSLCKQDGVNVEFKEISSLEVEVDEVDLIFIDTLHDYHQLRQELERHGNKAKKYLAFHDTITYGNQNEADKQCNVQGLVPAITEFLKTNSHWKELCTYTNNNGLTILERQCE